MSAELRQVADGFDYRVRSYSGYDVNGYHFWTRSHEASRANRKTTNSGVFTLGLDNVEYYGRIEEIYELIFMVPNLSIPSYSNAIGLIQR
jgi:hypothetical protein